MNLKCQILFIAMTKKCRMLHMLGKTLPYIGNHRIAIFMLLRFSRQFQCVSLKSRPHGQHGELVHL